jgi:hypothetical protein
MEPNLSDQIVSSRFSWEGDPKDMLSERNRVQAQSADAVPDPGFGIPGFDDDSPDQLLGDRALPDDRESRRDGSLVFLEGKIHLKKNPGIILGREPVCHARVESDLLEVQSSAFGIKGQSLPLSLRVGGCGAQDVVDHKTTIVALEVRDGKGQAPASTLSCLRVMEDIDDIIACLFKREFRPLKERSNMGHVLKGLAQVVGHFHGDIDGKAESFAPLFALPEPERENVVTEDRARELSMNKGFTGKAKTCNNLLFGRAGRVIIFGPVFPFNHREG